MKKTIYLFCLLICGSITLQAQTLERIAKQKADSIANAVEQQMQNMSFEEFEALANSSPYRGQFTRAELKRDYNKMHKNDGKAVKIYPQDYEKTDYQKLSEAMEAMKKSETYAEYHRHAKIVFPDASEEELRKIWEAQQKKKRVRQNTNKKKKEKELAEAIEAMSKAKNYAEYRRYAKIVFPDASEEELKEAWREQQKKNTRNSNATSNTENETNETENEDDTFGFEDLFGGDDDTSNDQKGGQERSQGKSNAGTVDLNSFDLGSLLDFAESDEAAEMGKKANEMEKKLDEKEMERMLSELERIMPKDDIEFFKMAGLSDRQSRALSAYDKANKDENAPVSERILKGEEYFRSFGVYDQRFVNFGVAMTVNTDPPKGVDTEYDDSRKRDYEETVEEGFPDGRYQEKLDQEEWRMILGEQLERDYGLKLSEAELDQFIKDFKIAKSQERSLTEDALQRCFDKALKKHIERKMK